MTTKEKQRALEAVGWKFERYSKSRKRWVRVAARSTRATKAVEHAWRIETMDV